MKLIRLHRCAGGPPVSSMFVYTCTFKNAGVFYDEAHIKEVIENYIEKSNELHT